MPTDLSGLSTEQLEVYRDLLAKKQQPAAATPAQPQGIHPLDSIGHAIHEYWNQIDPVKAAQGINAAVHGPIGTAKALGQQNADIWYKAKDAYDKGDYGNAIRHTVNYALSGIPGLGAGIESAQDKASAGDYSGMAGQSLGIGTQLAAPAYAPAAARGVGSGLKSAAAPLAESALGVRAIQRAYGKTPGVAALEDTSGFSPSKVAESARSKLGDLNTELESSAAKSTSPASLNPARQVIDARAKSAAAGNAASTPEDMAAMKSQLTDPRPGFAGAIDPATGQIAADQSPANILRMKREFGNEFTKWNPLHPTRDMGTARKAYGALDSELDRTVPGAKDLNQRISSLIPVAERAESTDLNAGIGQRLLHRAAAHTGALIGADAGYRAAGIPGAIAGFVAPELAASPAVRMAGARTLYGTGKAIGSPASQAGAAGATALGVAGQDADDSIARRMGRSIAQGSGQQ